MRGTGMKACYPEMESPMTIAYLADASSIHTQRWAAHFADLGCAVHVISLESAAIPGVEVHCVSLPAPYKAAKYLLAVPRVRLLLKRIRPDIVHAHYATGYGLVAALAGFRPLVITAWGSDVLIAPGRSRLLRATVSFALRRADLVHSLADHMTRALRDLQVPSERIVTLPFGTDTTVFHPPTQERRREGQIICTRPFEPIYNVEILIRSLPRVLSEHPDVRCVLVGDGALRRRLEILSDELGVRANIAWTGRVSPPEVAQRLSLAEVFITPSFSDGNNISLNEAMACGCFPICSDIPANREWIDDGENGFLVPPDRPDLLGDRVIEALQRTELRSRAAARNWEIVKARADWHKNMARMAQYYGELAGKMAPGRSDTR